MKTRLTFFIGILLVCTASVLAQNGGKAEPKRIKFIKGNLSANANGILSNNQEMEFVFGARAKQKVVLKVVSVPKGDLFEFEVDSANGTKLETEYDRYSNYTFTAPATGDYLVTVFKRPTEKVQRARFTLTLKIKQL